MTQKIFSDTGSPSLVQRSAGYWWLSGFTVSPAALWKSLWATLYVQKIKDQAVWQLSFLIFGRSPNGSNVSLAVKTFNLVCSSFSKYFGKWQLCLSLCLYTWYKWLFATVTLQRNCFQASQHGNHCNCTLGLFICYVWHLIECTFQQQQKLFWSFLAKNTWNWMHLKEEYSTAVCYTIRHAMTRHNRQQKEKPNFHLLKSIDLFLLWPQWQCRVYQAAAQTVAVSYNCGADQSAFLQKSSHVQPGTVCYVVLDWSGQKLGSDQFLVLILLFGCLTDFGRKPGKQPNFVRPALYPRQFYIMLWPLTDKSKRCEDVSW